MLEEAGRELLLLQASDWPFAVTNHRAVDYAIRRFSQHAGRFEHLAGIAERLAADPAHTTELDIVQKFDMWDAEVHDLAFPEIDLRWWDV